MARIGSAIHRHRPRLRAQPDLPYAATMLHFPTPAHYKAKPPLDVLMETVSPTRTILETVELPPNEIGDLQSVWRRVRLKWNSLSLDDRLNGVAVRAVSSAGESLLRLHADRFCLRSLQGGAPDVRDACTRRKNLPENGRLIKTLSAAPPRD